MKNIFVFDVESTSLHGEGFAVGAVVINHHGIILDKFELLSDEGEKRASEWVQINVLPFIKNMPRCNTMKEMRSEFLKFYKKHKLGADIWADCCFPVETNFLSAIVKDYPEEEYEMPYPLKDLSTICSVDKDRNELSGVPNLRKHNPLDDAVASATIIHNIIKSDKS